jgi:hypothetical protein
MINENTALTILQGVMDAHDEMIVVLENSKLIMVNDPFLNFFGEESLEAFNGSFPDIVDCFVNHPFYFNRSKIPEGKNWDEVIADLPENEKIISILSSTFEPHAFFVTTLLKSEVYKVLKFSDITKNLIKSIMIDNAHFPLFSGLKILDISKIVQLLQLVSFDKDEIVVYEGSDGDSMYFIAEGDVLVYNQHIQMQLTKGDLFGEIAILKKVPRTATVKALSECKVLELKANDLKNLIKTKPELLKEIEKIAESRLEETL